MTSTRYAHAGVAALVQLHERELRAFVDEWRRAQAAALTLPTTGDPAYASLEHLLGHVLRAAAGYVTWCCEQLGLPGPGLDAALARGPLTAEDLDERLALVLAGWRDPLASVTEEQAERGGYRSSWGAPYTIDSMLEHAVMHPIRHRHQLERLAAAGA